MSSVKDLGEPGWTRSPLSVKERKVIREDGHSVTTVQPAPYQTEAEVESYATLFAAAPELAGAVREYLERLEDEVGVAVRMDARHKDADTYRTLVDAKDTLSAASPLYAVLAKAYGKREV